MSTYTFISYYNMLFTLHVRREIISCSFSAAQANVLNRLLLPTKLSKLSSLWDAPGSIPCDKMPVFMLFCKTLYCLRELRDVRLASGEGFYMSVGAAHTSAHS